MEKVPSTTMNIHANTQGEIPTFSVRPIGHKEPGSFVSFAVQIPGTRIAWFISDYTEPLQELIANLKSVILEVEDIIDGVHADFRDEEDLDGGR